jgi:uncharacterized protein YcfL
MKKIAFALTVVAFLFVASCGTKTEEVVVTETIDSTAVVDTVSAVADSIAEAEAIEESTAE